MNSVILRILPFFLFLSLQFEKKQQVVQDEKTHAKIHEAEKKKELKKKLKVFDEKTHKAKLIYKGLASKTGKWV